MEKLASVSIDEKEQIYLNGKLLENVTAYKLENSTSSKEPAKLTVTMFVNVGQDMHEKKQEKPEYYTAEYYQMLIRGEAKERSGMDKFIRTMTKKDAGLVLSCIGLNHPASSEVFKYLADQKEQRYSKPNPFGNFIRRNSHLDPVKDQEKHPKEGDCAPYNTF